MMSLYKCFFPLQATIAPPGCIPLHPADLHQGSAQLGPAQAQEPRPHGLRLLAQLLPAGLHLVFLLAPPVRPPRPPDRRRRLCRPSCGRTTRPHLGRPRHRLHQPPSLPPRAPARHPRARLPRLPRPRPRTRSLRRRPPAPRRFPPATCSPSPR
jgi:hypothetical protein